MDNKEEKQKSFCHAHDDIKEEMKGHLEKFEKIRISLHNINEQMQNLQNVVIRNGGEREITMKRNQFYQMLYDEMKKIVKKDEIEEMIQKAIKEAPAAAVDFIGGKSKSILNTLLLIGQLIIIVKLFL